MSPRFERRPDKRASSGGKAPARPGRFQPRRDEGGRPERRVERGGDARGGARADTRGDFRPGPRGGGFDRGGFERSGSAERGGSFERRAPAARGGERGAGSSGERSFSRRPGGPRPGADRPFRERSGGDRPFRERSFGDRPSGERSFGERSFGDKPPSDRPFGQRSFGDRPPRAGRPGDRPAGRRPFGAKPFRDRSGDRPGDRFSRGPIVVDAPREQPAGEAERFGADLSPDLVWGRHAALAALESGRPIHRIWCTPEMRFSPKFLQLLREAKGSGVLVEEVTWARLGQVSGGAVHQGIVLQTAAAETLDLPSLIEGCRGLGEPPLLMAVDGLTDPHNLGAIVRSAEALGAHGLVLPQRRNAGLTGTVAKVAAGALENLPVARVVNLNRSLESLKQEGYRVIGLAGEGSITLEEADLDGPLVVVTGSEAEGLSMLTRRTCDQLVRIPLRGATPSLNASVATALLLYEIARRGWMKGITGSQPAPRISRPAIPTTAAEPAGFEPVAVETDRDELPAMAAADEAALLVDDTPVAVADESADESFGDAAGDGPGESLDQASMPAAEASVAEPTASPTLDLGLEPVTPAGFQGDIQL